MGAYSVARVIAEHKESYIVKNTTNEYLAKIIGRQMFTALSKADYLAVGDWVSIIELEKRRKDRKFGQFVKKALKQHKKYKI
ncbi:hypothetical protein KAS42_04120 [bacterium]|nr:hypothetical protein [bacterium]